MVYQDNNLRESMTLLKSRTQNSQVYRTVSPSRILMCPKFLDQKNLSNLKAAMIFRKATLFDDRDVLCKVEFDSLDKEGMTEIVIKFRAESKSSQHPLECKLLPSTSKYLILRKVQLLANEFI